MKKSKSVISAHKKKKKGKKMNHVETGWVALAHTWTVHQSDLFCQIDLLKQNHIHHLCQSGYVALSAVNHTQYKRNKMQTLQTV